MGFASKHMPGWQTVKTDTHRPRERKKDRDRQAGSRVANRQCVGQAAALLPFFHPDFCHDNLIE